MMFGLLIDSLLLTCALFSLYNLALKPDPRHPPHCSFTDNVNPRQGSDQEHRRINPEEGL